MDSGSFIQVGERLRGAETASAPAGALPFPVLLRMPRLPAEHERPPLVLPPLERPNRRGKLLAGAMIALALFLMTRWQGWLVTSRPAPAPPPPSRPAENILTLPPIRPTQTIPPVTPARQFAPPVAHPLIPTLPPAAYARPRQPTVRPGVVRARLNTPVPTSQPRPHRILITVEPGD